MLNQRKPGIVQHISDHDDHENVERSKRVRIDKRLISLVLVILLILIIYAIKPLQNTRFNGSVSPIATPPLKNLIGFDSRNFGYDSSDVTSGTHSLLFDMPKSSPREFASVAAWIWLDSRPFIGVEWCIISHGHFQGSFKFSVLRPGLLATIKFSNGQVIDFGVDIEIKEHSWQHVGFVFDGNEGFLRMYLNGKRVAERTVPHSSIASTNAPITIGQCQKTDPASVRFNGIIANGTILEKALSDDEMNKLAFGQSESTYFGFDKLRSKDLRVLPLNMSSEGRPKANRGSCKDSPDMHFLFIGHHDPLTVDDMFPTKLPYKDVYLNMKIIVTFWLNYNRANELQYPLTFLHTSFDDDFVERYTTDCVRFRRHEKTTVPAAFHFAILFDARFAALSDQLEADKTYRYALHMDLDTFCYTDPFVHFNQLFDSQKLDMLVYFARKDQHEISETYATQMKRCFPELVPTFSFDTAPILYTPMFGGRGTSMRKRVSDIRRKIDSTIKHDLPCDMVAVALSFMDNSVDPDCATYRWVYEQPLDILSGNSITPFGCSHLLHVQDTVEQCYDVLMKKEDSREMGIELTGIGDTVKVVCK